MRNLVTIQRIDEISPIENADRLEVATVLGWKCVTSKGEYKPGDLCVYFEVDSFLPVCDYFSQEKYDFLRKSSYKKTVFQGEGYRIKTQKLRGQISQGLILPLESVYEIGTSFVQEMPETLSVGDDVTANFGVVKFDPPEVNTGCGEVKGGRPYGIPKTDETRLQSIPEILDEMHGRPYYITTKMDGTSVTMYSFNGQFGICGRNQEYVVNDRCMFYVYAKEKGIDRNLPALNHNIAVQGEFCGPGIQKNRLHLSKFEWYPFNLLDIDSGEYLDFEELEAVAEHLGIGTVPVEEKGGSFSYQTVDEMLERARGKYPSGEPKEGIVVRTLAEEKREGGKRMSFKVLNNDFLLKEK